MNGVHDLGGMDGFGPVEVEAGEPVFHETWEGRVFGILATVTGGRIANIDEVRHAIERMDPLHYLGSSYYEHWLTGVATLLVEKGVLAPGDLESRAGGRFPLSRPVHDLVLPPAPKEAGEPLFAAGTTVAVRDIHPFGHTRCPRYVRGKRGVVVRVDARRRLPDVSAHAPHAWKEFQYCVRFEARELWGDGAGAGDTVHVDLWESYLEAP